MEQDSGVGSPCTQASSGHPECWTVMSWFKSVSLYSKLLRQHPQPCKSLQVVPEQARQSRHPCLTRWNAEAEAVPQNLVTSFHLSYHIWEQQDSYIDGISMWNPFKVAQYWVLILGDLVSWAGQVNKLSSEQTHPIRIIGKGLGCAICDLCFQMHQSTAFFLPSRWPAALSSRK